MCSCMRISNLCAWHKTAVATLPPCQTSHVSHAAVSNQWPNLKQHVAFGPSANDISASPRGTRVSLQLEETRLCRGSCYWQTFTPPCKFGDELLKRANAWAPWWGWHIWLSEWLKWDSHKKEFGAFKGDAISATQGTADPEAPAARKVQWLQILASAGLNNYFNSYSWYLPCCLLGSHADALRNTWGAHGWVTHNQMSKRSSDTLIIRVVIHFLQKLRF